MTHKLFGSGCCTTLCQAKYPFRKRSAVFVYATARCYFSGYFIHALVFFLLFFNFKLLKEGKICVLTRKGEQEGAGVDSRSGRKAGPPTDRKVGSKLFTAVLGGATLAEKAIQTRACKRANIY